MNTTLCCQKLFKPFLSSKRSYSLLCKYHIRHKPCLKKALHPSGAFHGELVEAVTSQLSFWMNDSGFQETCRQYFMVCFTKSCCLLHGLPATFCRRLLSCTLAGLILANSIWCWYWVFYQYCHTLPWGQKPWLRIPGLIMVHV